MKPSLAVLSWIVGLILTLVTVSAIRKRAVLDVPNDRSMHKVPTPRGGGIGIVAGFLIPALGIMFTNSWTYILVSPLLVGGVPVAAIGWLDDHRHVSPKWRALVHLGSCFLAFAMFSFLTHDFDFFLDARNCLWLGLVTIGGAYFLNLFNFMDGLDGLAGSEAAFVGIVAAGLLKGHSRLEDKVFLFDNPTYQGVGLQQSLCGLAGLLGFCCVGFLVWNWPPAKIFMGDVGSGFIGFALAFFALSQTYSAPKSIWVWLILLAVFLVDGTYTLLVRFLTRQKWYEAHSLHAFQKAAKKKSHLAVTLTVLAIDLFWLLPLASYVRQEPDLGPFVTVISYLPILFIAWRYRAGLLEPKPSEIPSVAQ